MKKIISIVLGIFIIAGVVIFYFASSKKNTEPEYMPCPVLEEGETMDVVIPDSMYRGLASCNAQDMKKEGRCVDVWVNDDGDLVIRLDQDTLEKNYNLYYDDIIKAVNHKESEVKEEVTYDFSIVTLYVNAETELYDFLRSIMVTPGTCYMLKLLQGIPREEANVDVVVIYEPTGKEILKFDKNTKMNINQEDWAKLLENGKN